MTERHYTARELAGLPGLPSTERAVQIRAAREGWQHRPRAARGGGREYPLAVLPAETQRHLRALDLQDAAVRAGETPEGARLQVVADELAEVAAIAADERAAAVSAGNVAAPIRGRDAGRIDARLEILRAADAFVAFSTGLQSTAMQAFTLAYNAGEVFVSPEARRAFPDVSPATLARWRRRVKSGGLVDLADRYGNRRGDTLIDRQAELREFIVGVLAAGPHLSAAYLIAGLRARFRGREDITLPSFRSLTRWVQRWRDDNRELLTALADPDAWKSRYRPAHGRVGEQVTRLNQRWEMDTTPGDIMLTDGRHQVLGVIDVHSRRAMLLVSKTSKATAVALLMRRAMRAWGVPETIATDNGADYTAKHITRVLYGLEIHHDLCDPFRPEQKPFIERFFRSFQHNLVEGLQGYIGHNVEQRRALERRASFAERLTTKGGVFEVGLSSEDFQVFADRWCEHLYQHRPHGSLAGRSPWEVVCASTDPVRTVRDERALDVLLAEAPDNHGLRTVQKRGLAIEGGWYVAPELPVGQEVHVRYDPADLGRVYAFRVDDGRFICEAICPDRTGVNRAEVASMAREIRTTIMRKKVREAKDLARRVRTQDVVNEVLSERAEAAGKLVRLRAPETDWVTDGITQAAEAARFREQLAHRDREGATAPDAGTEARVVQLMAEQRLPVDSPESRFERARVLLRRQPEQRNEDEQAWLASYVGTSEFRGAWTAFTRLELGGAQPLPDARRGGFAV
jgi:putative transposase